MMYDPRFVQPMREELTSIGFTELKSAAEVDSAIDSMSGPAMIVVNSICGCAAGAARPAVKIALSHPKAPKNLFTVFAGQDREATEAARSHFVGYPPSSPSIAIMKDGKIQTMVERKDIEGYTAPQIAEKLVEAFNKYC